MNIIKKIIDQIHCWVNKLIEFSLKSQLYFYITILIYSFFILPPSIKFICNIITKLKEDFNISNFISISSSIIGIFTFIVTTIVFFYKRRQFLTKVGNFKIAFNREIQKLLPAFEKINIDLLNEDFISYSLNKMTPTYIDLFDKYETIENFGHQFFKDLSYFISRFFKFKSEKKYFIELLMFQTNFKFRHKFIQELFNLDSDKTKSLLNNIFKIHLYYIQNEKINLNEIICDDLDYTEEQIQEVYFDIIKAEDSSINKLFESLENENLKNSVLQHVIDKTYSIVAVTKDRFDIISGPVLLIKNEENFQSWWSNLEKEVEIQLKNKNKWSEDKINTYNLKNEVKKVNEKLIKQPFSFSLKQDIYISPVLDQNPWSPIYLIDCNELPIPYRNKPIDYIEKVVKINAKKHLKKVVTVINKLHPKLHSLKKELIFDYELIPFNPLSLKIQTRPDKSPKAFESLFISDFIKSENREDFVKAHILQIKKVLSRISPISLIVNSCDRKTLLELTNIEIKIIKALNTKKYGQINFEGIDNIKNNEHNIKKIIDVIYRICKKRNLKITKKILKSIIVEIIFNANLIKESIR